MCKWTAGVKFEREFEFLDLLCSNWYQFFKTAFHRSAMTRQWSSEATPIRNIIFTISDSFL